MNIERFKEIINERERIVTDCNDEWDYGIDCCWKKEVEILSEDVHSTIEYLKNSCTGDEYSWISEIIDDLIEKTQSKELLDCYKTLADKYPEEYVNSNISQCIEFAEYYLKNPSQKNED